MQNFVQFVQYENTFFVHWMCNTFLKCRSIIVLPKRPQCFATKSATLAMLAIQKFIAMYWTYCSTLWSILERLGLQMEPTSLRRLRVPVAGPGHRIRWSWVASAVGVSQWLSCRVRAQPSLSSTWHVTVTDSEKGFAAAAVGRGNFKFKFKSPSLRLLPWQARDRLPGNLNQLWLRVGLPRNEPISRVTVWVTLPQCRRALPEPLHGIDSGRQTRHSSRSPSRSRAQRPGPGPGLLRVWLGVPASDGGVERRHAQLPGRERLH